MNRHQYDPFNRDEDRAREQAAAARDDHQVWSLQQSLLCNAAAQRENTGQWIKRVPDILEEGRS